MAATSERRIFIRDLRLQVSGTLGTITWRQEDPNHLVHSPVDGPRRILTRQAFENAITVVIALGGSTNAVLHLLAIARAARIKLTLDDFTRIGKRVPVLPDLKPNGKYVMAEPVRIGGLTPPLKRPPEETVQPVAAGPVRAGGLPRSPDLSLNLALTQNHRVEARGHAEQMLRHPFVTVDGEER